jgi:SRSO17 transposase
MKTFTPDLDPAALGRLREYAARFAPDFPQSKPARWAGVYLQGLLADGERKSVEPLSRRVTLPPDLSSADPEQALQQFVNQSTWNHQKVLTRYRALMAERFATPEGVFVLDDTSFPKQGLHSVGVSHQYCGALGKRANCQVAVTLHYSGPRGHFPLDLRLHLPESWTGDTKRMGAAGVPEASRAHRTKGQIALELLDRARNEGLAGATVVADLGYGRGTALRDGLAERGLKYVVGVPAEALVFPAQPTWVHPPRTSRRGRAPSRWVLAPDAAPPVTIEAVAKELTLRRVSWRHGTKGKLSARFGWVRVWPGHEWKDGSCAHAEPVWLLVEARDDGQIQYALSNLPAKTSRVAAVRLWKQRWRIEQGHQQMKEELGLDHFEGRSWRGFHHHAAMVLLAYGFLLLEQNRPRPEPAGSGKKGRPNAR